MAARDARVDVRDYDLPSDPNRLHKLINKNIGKFERLLDALDAAGSRRLSELARLLA